MALVIFMPMEVDCLQLLRKESWFSNELPDYPFPGGTLPFFFLSFFNLEGIQLQHLLPLYKYFDKWFLSCHAYPKQGYLSFWKATVYSPPTLNAESALGGGGEGGAARPTQFIRPRILKKKERKAEKKNPYTTIELVTVVSLATKQQSGALCSAVPR